MGERLSPEKISAGWFFKSVNRDGYALVCRPSFKL